MKQVLGYILLSFGIMSANGQIIYFGMGKTISAFDYKNSAGVPLNNLKSNEHGSLTLGFRYPMFQTASHVSCNMDYFKYNSKGSDPILGNYYTWDFNNLGVNLGVDYEFFKPSIKMSDQKGLSFYIKAATAAEFLLNGTQNINNRIYDLKGVEQFDKPFYFLRGGIGVNYYLSKTYLIFIQYMGGRSFLIGNYDHEEQLHLITHNVTIGLSINTFFLLY